MKSVILWMVMRAYYFNELGGIVKGTDPEMETAGLLCVQFCK